MTPRRIERHVSAFRLLLWLYPEWFRDAHGEEMAALFETRLKRAAGLGARARFWWRIVNDAVSTAAALRRRDTGKGGLRVETLLLDVRYAARHLLRSPVFTVGAIAILAIGIGANTTVFTLVDALIFRPPPWDRPESLVHVYQDSDDGEPSSNSFPATRDMAEVDVFSSLTAWSPSNASWEGPDGPEPVATEYVTSSYMRTLGLDVQRGRWFSAEDDVVGGAPVAVVSAPSWHARLGSDPDVVGRTIRLNGQPVTIIGVGPERLTSTAPPLRTDFWLSLSATLVTGDAQVANLERRQDHWYQALARLAPGVTVTRAQSAMDALAARLAEEYPEFNRGRGITVFSSTDVRQHPQGDRALFLAGGLLSAVVLTVLLLACANLANLLLVRGLSRSGEMAVRSALGASRGRVARLILVESLLLSGLGGIAGLVLTRLMLSTIPSLPLADVLGGTLELAIDGRVAVFALALMAFTGILFGLSPALRLARTDVGQALREDRRGATGGRRMVRLRDALVAVQVAASLVLVLGAGLLARSLGALQTVETGVDVDRVAYLSVDWAPSGLPADQIQVEMEALRERVRALPGITSVGLASRLPAQPSGSTTTEVEGYVPTAGTDAVELDFAIVTDGYFETMGIPLVRGRLFTEDDVPGDDQSIVINQATARRFWGDGDPIGRRMRGQGSQDWTRTVVGVVADAKVASLGEGSTPMFYFSTRQFGVAPRYLVARTDGDPSAILTSMRQELTAFRSSAPVNAQGTLAEHFGTRLGPPRLAARIMSLFSILALLLAGLGIYTVVSFTVARRSSELGIRMALGADRLGVVGMVLREVAGVVGVGLAVGLALAVLAASRVGDVVYGVSTLDPLTLGGSVLVLLLVAWTAAFVPARRAARADPVETLRAS